ncbi:geranylgeranyl pyrophosphate synthase [Pseudomonas sp. 02C 26]|uniref:polyprenyl synthetase family protein n=1 Tax=Pseudomonas sp. 02C 26 TaxID=2054914 RepID=UPI000C6D3B0F|nr:polyprenyl synthetase family protein [Pseudomonas sp. 02C 26]AUF96236.1 geranylgeranyl pyrophosphate synthase [Pseudomonas sp. 02C 26]
MTTIARTTSATDADFAVYLARLRAELDSRLSELLPEVGHERDLLAAAMRESALAPGKRLRPLLLLLTAESLGGCKAAALDLGCAIEMVHAASLVLDDLPCMDNAALRRGRPTLHLAFGEDVAILAAIALLSRAFGVVAALHTVEPEQRNRLIAIMSQTIGAHGLVKGQLQDLRDGATVRSAEQITETNQLKTGVLFAAIMDMACLLGHAHEGVRQPLQRFASELGQAFQLQDDLRDCDPDTGKDLGKDAGKSTLFALCGETQTRHRLHSHLEAAEQCLEQVFLAEQPIGCLLRAVFANVRSPLAQSNFCASVRSAEVQVDISRSTP